MALSREHTSAKAADHAKLLMFNKYPVEQTQCRGVSLGPA